MHRRFDDRHYVPILKARQGEFRALSSLDDDLKSVMTPLFEVAPIPATYTRENRPRPPEGHFDGFLSSLETCWGEKRPAFVDLLLIEPTFRLAHGEHPLAYLLRRSRDQNVLLIPTVSPSRPAEYLDEVGRAVAEYGGGVCLRLPVNSFRGGAGPYNDVLSLLRRIGIGRSDADLVLDFESVSLAAAASSEMAARHLLSDAHIGEWRTVTIAGTGFPPSLSGCVANGITPVERIEWSVWLAVLEHPGSASRLPTFGDYCIAHPVQVEFDPQLMRMSASIRYTAEREWLVVKGRNVRGHGFEQCRTLCTMLMQRSEYSGAGYSWGDCYIAECAAGRESPGNATTWRAVGTSHHLTMVPNQISTVHAS